MRKPLWFSQLKICQIPILQAQQHVVCTLVDTEATSKILHTIWTNPNTLFHQYWCHVIFTANTNLVRYRLTVPLTEIAQMPSTNAYCTGAIRKKMQSQIRDPSDYLEEPFWVNMEQSKAQKNHSTISGT